MTRPKPRARPPKQHVAGANHRSTHAVREPIESYKAPPPSPETSRHPHHVIRSPLRAYTHSRLYALPAAFRTAFGAHDGRVWHAAESFAMHAAVANAAIPARTARAVPVHARRETSRSVSWANREPRPEVMQFKSIRSRVPIQTSCCRARSPGAIGV